MQKGIRSSRRQCTSTWGMWIWVFRKLNAERYNSKYSAMKAMGWRENQLRFIEKSLLFAVGQTLSDKKLYARRVTKTRTKADNIVKIRANYLCEMRKNPGDEIRFCL